MPRIFPFYGWRYNQDLVADLRQVVTPPYDVISSEDQGRFYARSPYNFIRLLLNKSPGDEKYHEAARFLREWQESGVLIREEEKVFYLLSQVYEQDGKEIRRSGIVAELEIEEFGGSVLPHEQTIEKHIADRYRLMETTYSNLGQIFMSYRDVDMTVESVQEDLINTEPVMDVMLEDDIRYQIWRISDPESINDIQNVLEDTNAIIMDGHHRYKTALRFAQDHPEVFGSDRVMVTLVNTYNPGLNILPTHRKLTNLSMDFNEALSKLQDQFDVTEVADPGALLEVIRDAEGKAKKTRFGLYHRESESSYILQFKNPESLKDVFPRKSQAGRESDLNILHHFVLKDAFGIDTTSDADIENVSYIRGSDSTVDIINSQRDYEVICFVNPPDLDEVFAIAESGETMPQKSTYFYPKVNSGLILRCFG
jgi:uncharacterized protein (DUF1015 family)